MIRSLAAARPLALRSGFTRLLALAILITTTYLPLRAVQARGELITLTQPDGTTVKARLIGDENYHYYVTEDGTPLELDGAYYRRGKAPKRRVDGTGRPAFGLFPGTAFPSTGEQKALVILVQFNNRDFYTQNPHDYFTDLLNADNYTENGCTGSARQYFIDNSGGRFKPQFDVYGPVTMPNSASYYGENNELGYDIRPHEMVIEACRQLDESVDFSQYDRDNDGIIDNVFVFYAGQGEATGGAKNTIWPHSQSIKRLQLGTSYVFDGVELNNYACTNEWIDNHSCYIGTFCHEFSHVLGLPDLYTTTYETGVFSPGTWSVLDRGPYNNDQRTPPAFTAFERYALGWLEPLMIDGEADVTLKPITENEAAIIHAHDEGEYFMLENRQQSGWDEFIPGHGMLIWHIDYVPRVWEENKVNNDANHQYVDIEEADNIQDDATRDGDAFPGTAGVTEINDDTTPSLRPWTGRRLKTALTQITETPDGLITFKAGAPNSGVSSPDAISAGVSIDGRKLSFRSAEAEACTVAMADGRTIWSATAKEADMTLPGPGVYIVVAGTSTHKIFVK